MTLSRLRPSSPAPARSTKASAIWATMNAWRRPCAARLEVLPRDSDWSAGAAWPRRLYQAMGTASAMPRIVAPASAIRASRASKAIRAPKGKWAAPSAPRRRIPAAPTARPSSPPPTVSRVVSTITSRTMCPWLAPSACRTASSFARPLARIKSRFTRLTAPIRRREKAPPWRRSRVGRMGATWLSCRGTTRERKPASAIALPSGLARSVTSLCASSCAWARATVAPSASRPIMWDELPQCRRTDSRSSGLDENGKYKREREDRKLHSGGRTPTTTLGSPSTRILRPITSGSAPSLCRQ